MLQKLEINHYAIIDKMSLAPHTGLNVVTGETGAGKSIILGALTLILGVRADPSLLLRKDRKLVVEAWFDLADRPAFNQLLEAEGLDTDTHCCIRREINAQGKSRAFINDTPVNLSLLQRLTGELVDLHQQFDHHALQEQDFQIQVIDALADLGDELKDYGLLYQRFEAEKKQCALWEAAWVEWNKETDYRRYLLEELQEANFQPQEIEKASEAWKKWEHGEAWIRVLNESRQMLEEEPTAIISALRRLQSSWTSISREFEEMNPLASRMESLVLELEDLAMELDRLGATIDLDPEEGQRLAERIDLGYRLLKKHGQPDTEGLLKVQQDLELETHSGEEREAQIQASRQRLAEWESELEARAQRLHEARKKAGSIFLEKMAEMLPRVGMPNARWDMEFQDRGSLGPRGRDRVVFLLDANRSGSFQPVYKAASGGELSRIMLCIKSITARKVQWPTMIFDEVDTGTSGEAARQVALLLKDLSTAHQVICITHQVQVAAQADRHFFVYKTPDEEGVARTRVRTLDEASRIRALAEMIAGDPPTEAAYSHARELMGLAGA